MQNRLPRPLRLPGAPADRVRRLARSAPERARRATDGVRIRARRAVRRGGRVPGLLSIVVPCYQVEDFLDECLVSLRFQHYREVEIIVVDDGSPDRSGEIARRHARRDLRVRVVTRENGGLSAARNTGIEHARGEFLTFVDSDDVVTPSASPGPTSSCPATTGSRTRSGCPPAPGSGRPTPGAGSASTSTRSPRPW
jgi:cellulose synthase/poly-beta-1,6-N-acetylglucosamine synthase-like glycosyltransferase